MVIPSPVITPHYPIQQQQYPYPDYNQYAQQMHNDQLWQQYYMNQAYQNSMMAYGDQSAAEQYYHSQDPSPLISELARQYVSQTNDMQYERQLLDPYQQYLNDPYLIQNYL
jgi:hypothetical protein